MENEIQRPQEDQELKIGIIGLGFVGKAVSAGFSGPRCNKMIIDPKYNSNTLKDLSVDQVQFRAKTGACVHYGRLN